MSALRWTGGEAPDGSCHVCASTRKHDADLVVELLPDGQARVELKVVNRATREPERCVRGLSIDLDQVAGLVVTLKQLALETCFLLDSEDQIVSPAADAQGPFAAIGAGINARNAFSAWAEEERQRGYLQ